jgi:NAD(P)-dependent dehydrogenase (short-subunit alcohol dehydrogenase family)
MDAGPLADKTVVVIGGTTGLGLSAVKACLAAGARVVAVGRNPANVSAVAALGGRVRALAGDAVDPQTAVRAIDEAVRAFGGFDGLYHVAGGSGRSEGDGPLHQLSDRGIEFTLDLNLKSLILSNRAAARRFLAQGTPGSVLNMSSVLAFSPSPRYFATHAYAAAKAAVIGLTRAAAAYYARHSIRFNAIAPALFETPMSRRAQESPEVLDFVSSKQPLDGGRLGRPADADAAVVYFLSDASRFVTGQVLAVDGGWSVTEGAAASREVSAEHETR